MNYLLVLSLVAYVLQVSFFISSSSFNLIDYGAVGDGVQDDSQAFSKAWKDLCDAENTNDIPTLTIPAEKTFLLTPTLFEGPCKSSSVHVEIQGRIVAPSDRSGWTSCEDNNWLYFSDVDNLIVDGSGQFDGKGAVWWNNNFANKKGDNSCDRPNGIKFSGCNGLQLNGLTHIDSPRAHLKIQGCNNSIISNLNIIAPANSHNTDGIDIRSSTQVQILDSIIATGDDCIAIGHDISWLNISGITCGPGHGISIGSLGKDGSYAQVEQVLVKNCTFNGSTNGARIKTWQGGSGYARNITFEDIPLINVKNPIIIDQYYCDLPGHNCTIQESAVEVKDVTYKGFQGTSISKAVISLNCSSSVACTDIFMNTIDISSSDQTHEPFAVCINAQGTQNSVQPQVPCLN